MSQQDGDYLSGDGEGVFTHEDPLRRGLSETLHRMDAAERARWEAELALTDRLREELPSCPAAG